MLHDDQYFGAPGVVPPCRVRLDEGAPNESQGRLSAEPLALREARLDHEEACNDHQGN
jgi:hypothetical protein